MLSSPLSVRIRVASAPVDLRKGFDGLAAIVQNDWRQDLYAGPLEFRLDLTQLDINHEQR